MTKWIRRVVFAVALLLAIAIGVFACREQIERGIIAYRICSAGIFRPPLPRRASRDGFAAGAMHASTGISPLCASRAKGG